MRAERYVVAALTAGLILGAGGPAGPSGVEARSVVATAAGEALIAGIDPSRTGELTLIFERPNPNDDHVGQSPVGVPVDLRRVAGLDLTANEGWRRAAGLTVEEVLGLPDTAFDHDRSGISGTGGFVTFTGLPLGLYAVTPVPGADKTFEPFVVTIPMTDPSGSTWRYSLTAHPKIAAPREDPSETPSPPTGPTEPTDPTEPSEPAEPTSTTVAPPGEGEPTVTDEPAHSATPPMDTPAAPPGSEGRRPGRESGLAATGAAVTAVIVVGVLLVVLGLVLMRRRGREAFLSPSPPTHPVEPQFPSPSSRESHENSAA